MALQITKNSGIYEINGNLNSQNVQSLNNHFESLLEHSKMIAVSLNKLKDIDKTAVKAIANIYNKALSSNKVFYIIGQENQKISEQFKIENLNSILYKDAI